MIFVAARDAEAAEAFLDRHGLFQNEVSIFLGQTSYYSVINQVLEQCAEDIAVLVHDDVFLRSSFPTEVRALKDRLDREWPNWGLAGNAGIAPHGVGLSGTRVVRFLADPHGGPNMVKATIPAETLDGNLLLLNLRALRERNFRIPAFNGFQMYDIILSVEVLAAGLGVLLVPELACYHASAGNQSDFDLAAKSDAARLHLASRVTNSQIETLNGILDLEDVTSRFFDENRFEVSMQSLRNSQVRRDAKSVAIVTRTRFNRMALLERNLETVSLFRSLASAAETLHVVVSSVQPEDTSRLGEARFLQFENREGGDDRFRLIKRSAETLDADYLWFVDDDDWLFPNAAEYISLLVSTAPAYSTIFLDTRHFIEHFTDAFGDKYPAAAQPSRKFPAKQFLGCLTGHNRIPFCGVILSREAVASLPEEVVGRVVLFEDLATILHVMSLPDFFPVVGGVLAAGISIRGEGQTVFSEDRTAWNESMAALVPSVTQGLVGSTLHSMPRLGIRFAGQDLAEVARSLNLAREAHYFAMMDIERMRSSWSWRITRPFRVIFRRLIPTRFRHEDPKSTELVAFDDSDLIPEYRPKNF